MSAGVSIRLIRVVQLLAVVAALWWAKAVIVPLVVSVLASYALEPVVARMESYHVRRSCGVPVLLLAIVCLGGAGAYALRGEATAFVDRIPSAIHVVARAIERSPRDRPGTVAKVQEAARELENAASTATKKALEQGVTAVRIEQPTFNWSDWLWQGSSGAIAIAGQMFVVVCLAYYLLVAGDLFKRKLVRIVPTLSEKKLTLEILDEINRQIERFLLARVLISVIVGIVVWAMFLALRMDDAGVWGVLAAILYAIPYVGPVVIVGGGMVAAFVQFGTLSMAVGVGGGCLAIGALEGYVLTPWLMSRVGEMNPMAVFVSLLFWSWLWGGWGLFLAVPITAAAKAIGERVPDLNDFAELLRE